MIIGIKDALRLVGVVIISACAVFVCTLFLNYNIDLAGIRDSITTEAGAILYDAQVSMGKVTCAVTGGCLGVTSAAVLIFYVKNYIDAHKRELGILKVLGCPTFRTALHFSVFGASAFLGTSAGFIGAWCYLPKFYVLQNAEGLFPNVTVRFHLSLMLCLTVLPSLILAVTAVLYSCIKLKAPPAELLRNKSGGRKIKAKKEDKKREASFLTCVKIATLRERKMLAFFMAFSSFCFSAMTQMSLSMKDLSSEAFAFMIITIGLVLAFTILLIVLETVVKANAENVAIMRAYGYTRRECAASVLGAYRLVTFVGFAVGSVYQYALLKAVVTIVFADVDAVPEYSFDVKAMLICFAAFLIIYETSMYIYSLKIDRRSTKTIMSE